MRTANVLDQWLSIKRGFSIERFWRRFPWLVFVIIVLMLAPNIPGWIRNARLIHHIDDVGGSFYSYHTPMVSKVLGKHHYTVKNFLLPKLSPILGPNWPGIFKNITRVRIEPGNESSDWNLDYLRNQKDIRWLDVSQLPLENSDLEPLETLPSLECLYVNLKRIDSNGIAKTAKLKKLKKLLLFGRPISEAEVLEFSKLNGLTYIGLDRSEVYPEKSKTAELFLQQLPTCSIGGNHIRTW